MAADTVAPCSGLAEAGSGGASDSARARPAAPSDTGAPRRVDVRLLASVSAREIRFAAQPRVVIRMCGGVLDSVHVLERRNLPSPVVAGTTYRNVYVAIEILGHLTSRCLVQSLGGADSTARSVCAAAGVPDSSGRRSGAPGAPGAPTRRPPP